MGLKRHSRGRECSLGTPGCLPSGYHQVPGTELHNQPPPWWFSYHILVANANHLQPGELTTYRSLFQEDVNRMMGQRAAEWQHPRMAGQ